MAAGVLISRHPATPSWEMIREELKFSGGGIHRDLARLLRIRFVGGAPHGESEGRYSPSETERKVIRPTTMGSKS
jgi:hypothetical protein